MIRYNLLLIVLVLSLLACKTKEPKPDFSFAFLTDIHLEYGKNAVAGFRQAIDTLNKLNPAFVITGGDLIADALGKTEEEATTLYNLYDSMASFIKAPVHNAMGNHEMFGVYEKSGVPVENPLWGKKMFEAKVGKRYYSFDQANWHFVVLDDLEITSDRKYTGSIDSLQIEWIKNDLLNVPVENPVVITAHFPFISSATQYKEGGTSANTSGLVVKNGKDVLEFFKHKNLKLVLQGHLHYLEDIFINNQIHFITGGAVSSAWWTGKRDGLEEGFIWVDVYGTELKWHYVDFGWSPEREKPNP